MSTSRESILQQWEEDELQRELQANRVSIYWGQFRLRVDVDIAAAHNLPPAAQVEWETALNLLRAQYARSVEQLDQVTTANRNQNRHE
jgi:hypothetical protein